MVGTVSQCEGLKLNGGSSFTCGGDCGTMVGTVAQIWVTVAQWGGTVLGLKLNGGTVGQWWRLWHSEVRSTMVTTLTRWWEQ